MTAPVRRSFFAAVPAGPERKTDCLAPSDSSDSIIGTHRACHASLVLLNRVEKSDGDSHALTTVEIDATIQPGKVGTTVRRCVFVAFSGGRFRAACLDPVEHG